MSKEDLRQDVVEAFIDHNDDAYVDYLYELFDRPEVREAFAIRQAQKFLTFKERYEESERENSTDRRPDK